MGPLVNRYLCKDGSHRWFEWRSIAHLDRGLVYAVARDVTEQKLAEGLLAAAAEREEKLQRQLMFADRMASVGTLAAGVAHQINNPLASAAANIAIILEQLDRSPEERPGLRAMAADVQVAAERIRKSVRSLMTLSRAEEERRNPIQLARVLELATDITENELHGRARLVKDYGVTPLVSADEARLGHVFINLLVNAVQALPEGRSDANEIRIVTSTDPEGRAVVEVRDNGVGIPESRMSRIFDPFFTTQAVGVGIGLGLSICHAIVTGMGGEISVVSEPGRGATFRVTLPAAAPVESEVTAPASPQRVTPASGAILVVDDEVAVGMALGRVLGAHAVTVVSAARQALALLESGVSFDLILSDLMMPDMSGMEFYDELVERFPATAQRVIFMSGGAYTPRASSFLERVSNARIDKPFDPSAVRVLVQRHLSAARAG